MQMTKLNLNAPMIMEMMQGGMPLQLPEMPFEKDPISKWFQNLSLRQMAKYEATKADIAVSRNIQAENYLATMQRAILFGDTIFEEKQKMKDEQEKRKAEIQMLTAQATQAYFDAKSAEWDFKMREKKFKEMMGGEDDA
jgi:hypothetical protein